jgi:hypothetical protein
MTGVSRKGTVNVTGTWHGQYSYRDYRQPVFFVATLREAAGRIEGATEELRPVTGETLCAAIGARRSGGAVTFVKTYRDPPLGYGAVCYDGTLNADGTEIEGSWQIPTDGHGKFLMIRWNSTEEEIVREVSEFV